MARWHVRALAEVEEYQLAALCDIDRAHAEALAHEVGGAVYGDYAQMLAREKPDVVVIVTPTDSHARLTIQAAEAGVRGVYCEKPMATCLGDGLAMVAACREHGVALAVNHQRRMSPPILRLKALLNAGAIGRPELCRGSCAGDLLSDATHLVDTIRFLNDDAPVTWVFGQVHREVGPEVRRDPKGVQLASAGWRYGHPVETGAMGVFEFGTGVRVELFCGDLRLPQRAYGDYELFGSDGRLWRPGDGADPALLLQDGTGGWRAVEGLQVRDGHAETGRACYTQFARMVRDGAEHPLNGESALHDLEIIMALFESAGLRQKVTLPLTQMAFPLEMMVAEGG
jgi:predicted dehydrogenase